ncbi:MAG: hypothetical protein ABI091_07270 [Ferruginibacter sp.]
METVNCINLWNREDRLLSISKQAKDQRFAIRFWEATTGQIAYRAITLSHKKIIQDAKDKGLEYVIIMEDDCVFTAPNAFDFYMSKMPKEFDLYLGMIYGGEIKDSRILNGFSGLTLYTVHNRFYDECLASDPNDHLDRFLGNSAFKNKYYVCDPFVCHQTGGYSDNRRENMNYQVYHDTMKFYEG